MGEVTRAMIHDYLHDALPPDQAASVERAIRAEPALMALVQQVRQEVDRGDHSIGAIWWRERLSCPSREQMSSYLQDILDPPHAEYVSFHLKTIGCPFCQANLDDLARLRNEAAETRRQRRQRILDSSAGLVGDVPRPA